MAMSLSPKAGLSTGAGIADPSAGIGGAGLEGGASSAGLWLLYDNFDDATNDGLSIVNGVSGSTHAPNIVNGAASDYWVKFTGDDGPILRNTGDFADFNMITNNAVSYPLTSAELQAGQVYFIEGNFNTSASGSDTTDLYFALPVDSITYTAVPGAIRIRIGAAIPSITVFVGTTAGQEVLYNAAYSFPASGDTSFYVVHDWANQTINVYDSTKTTITGDLAYSEQGSNVYAHIVGDDDPDTEIRRYGIWNNADITTVAFP